MKLACRAAPLLVLLLGTCSAPPPRPDTFPALMGRLDAHLLDIQNAAADPREPERLRAELAGLRETLQRTCALAAPREGFAGRVAEAVEELRSLEAADWTPDAREEHWRSLRKICAGCHRKYDPPLDGPARRPSSWDACGRCHERVYAEWKDTLHARAWTDPVYRQAAGNPPSPDCRGCHSMEPILEGEISTDYGWRPRYRPYLQEEGVNCLACHGLSDGAVAAARDIPGAPCRPKRDDRLRTSEFCGACHNPSHRAYDEWKAAGLSTSCADCHATAHGKFTHRMRGVHEPAFVKDALVWSVSDAGDAIEVLIENRSGHKLPAEVPSRVLRLEVDLDERLEVLLFRRPPKAIIGSKDNRLLPGERRKIRIPTGGAKSVELRLRYQTSPFDPPDRWIEIGRWTRGGDK